MCAYEQEDAHTDTCTQRHAQAGTHTQAHREEAPQREADGSEPPRRPSHFCAHEKSSLTPAKTLLAAPRRPSLQLWQGQGPGPVPLIPCVLCRARWLPGAHVPQGPQTSPWPPHPTQKEVVRAWTLQPWAQDSGVGAPHPKDSLLLQGSTISFPKSWDSHWAIVPWPTQTAAVSRLHQRGHEAGTLPRGSTLTGRSSVLLQTRRRRGQCADSESRGLLSLPLCAEPNPSPSPGTPSPLSGRRCFWKKLTFPGWERGAQHADRGSWLVLCCPRCYQAQP